MKFSGASRFLPSRRVGALVVIVAALIASVVIVRADDTPAPKPVIATLTSDPQHLNETDTDGDTVPDWEEELWGLSAVKADSDGDGVGDADEIKQNKELFDQLPNDLLADATKNPDKVTPIGLAGRVLLSQFLTSKQAGVSYSESDVQNAAKLTLDAQQGKKRTYKTYTISDITLSDKTDAASLHTYGNAYSDALINKSSEPAPNELSVLFTFGQSNDPKKFAADMQKVIDHYDITINGLRAVTVPSNASDVHLKSLNALQRVRTDLSDMAAIETDPITALQAFSVYKTDSSAMIKSFDDVRAFLTNSGVAFNQSESGYLFMNPPQTTN